VSEFALVGGGELARPGEVSLAHCGVLFLDELGEFRRGALEALREPLEDGCVSIARVGARAIFPARPTIVAAMNGCPCGHMGSGTGKCACSKPKVQEYRARISGPLVDRLDVHVTLGPVQVEDLQKPANGEPSAVVRKRVEAARERQRARRDAGVTTALLNAHLSTKDLERLCVLDEESSKGLAEVMRAQGLSARAYAKILRVARTIADLRGAETIARDDVIQATSLRVLDKELKDTAFGGDAPSNAA
jgi:magnesium chelatase family protein